MNIDFKLLWVDDNSRWIKATEKRLRKWLDEKGFELQVTSFESAKGVIQEIKKTDFDLLIIDYKLKNKERGNTLIHEVRKNEYYQDIIFYSEGSLPEEPFDGVFTTPREHFLSRVIEIIDLKIRRLTNPASLRGWMVADSIGLEQTINEIILASIEDVKGLTLKKHLFSEKMRWEFSNKHKLLQGILNDQVSRLTKGDPHNKNLKQWHECAEISKSFPKEIINVRNTLAHQKVEFNDKGKVIKSSNIPNISLKEEKLIEIRKNIIKHRNNLKKAFELISK